MYKGYLDVKPTEEEWSELYSAPANNLYDCVENQYIMVENSDGDIDHFKWFNLADKRIINGFI